MLVPFLVLAVRLAAHRGHVFQSGDFALMDLEVHRAARWQQLLGPYDRFGWHHPGPLYLYLISFVERVVGQAHAPQAEALTATLVNGASLAGTIVAAERVVGRRRLPVVAAAGAALVVAIGPQAIFNAWNPYVVVLPLVLLSVLAVAASRGSLGALGAMAVVGTFAVQTDVGCLPLVVVLSGGAVVTCVLARRGLRGRPGGLPGGPILMVAVAALAWVPVLYQQVTGSPANLSSLASFFLHHRSHAGVVAGLRTAGLDAGSAVGLPADMLPSSGIGGILELAVALVGFAALAVVAARRRDDAARRFLLVALVGVLVSALAGLEVVGPTYAYLLAWAAAPTVVGVMGALLLLTAAPGGAARKVVRWAPLAALAAAGGLLARALLIPEIGNYSDHKVAGAWTRVAPVVTTDARTPVGLWFVSPEGWSVGSGIADELRQVGIPFTVLPRWAYQFDTNRDVRPSRWIVLADRETSVPARDRVVARISGGTWVAMGPDRPSG